MPSPNLDRWRAYVDGAHVVLRRGRVRAFRRRAEELGLGVPPARPVPGGQLVQIGLSRCWPDLVPVVALLADFRSRIDKLELAVEFRVPQGLDPDVQLSALLARLTCRVLPDRQWRQPAGLDCYYLAHENAPLNGCAYSRSSSKVPGIVGAVDRIELRLRHHWLDDLGLDDPGALLRLSEARILLVHALLFEMTGTRIARVRACARTRLVSHGTRTASLNVGPER